MSTTQDFNCQMAWNGSDGAAKPQKVAKKSKPSVFRGLLAAIIVIGGAVGAYLMFLGPATGGGTREKTKAKPAKIAEVAPELGGANHEVTDDEQSKPLPPHKPHEVRNGMLMLSNGQLLPTNKLRKVSVADRKPRFKYAIFEHSTDNELAAIMTLTPGQALIGGPIRRMDYKGEFLKSIETPIIVHNDDPEDVQEVKRAVIEARLLIKDAIDKGEDPADIISEAYEEAQKLALYKEDIRKEVMNMAKEDDYTEEEVDDLIASANILLEAKGIEPISLGPIMKARLRTLKQ